MTGLVVVSIVFRYTMGVWIFDTYLSRFPHFSSPLISVRDMKEMFHSYSKTGSFLTSPVQIGQSEALTLFLYFLQKTFGDWGIRAFLTIIDIQSLVLQIVIQ